MQLAESGAGFYWELTGALRAAPYAERGMILCCGGSRGLLLWRRGFGFFPTHADELGDAGLLHRHAIKHAAHLHGLAVVGDDDELGLAAHLADQAREAPDVGFIERRVDFIKDAEGAWLIAEDGNEECQRGHGFFAAGEQQHVLQALARR